MLLGRAFAQLQVFGLVSAGLSMPQILSTGAKCNAHAKEYVVFGARSPVADFLSPSHEWQADPNQYVLLGAGHSQTLLKVLKKCKQDVRIFQIAKAFLAVCRDCMQKANHGCRHDTGILEGLAHGEKAWLVTRGHVLYKWREHTNSMSIHYL